MSLKFLLLWIAALILTGLVFYALLLWSKVYRQTRQRPPQAPAKEAERRERQRDINTSITLLARAMLQDQVTKTEAAIRISTLARGLGANSDKARFLPFDELARATAHIPTLERWSALSPGDKNRYDAERLAIEAEHNDAIMDAARTITAHP